MSEVTQGLLLGHLLKRVSPCRLAVLGRLSSTLAYALWGAATHSWIMFAITFVSVLGATSCATIQSIISGAADGHSQGRTRARRAA